jgi:Spx/MgsR family transcriptional regulator
MALTLYGISNCDTVRKARRWLDAAGVAYRFHDFREDGTDPKTVSRWLRSQGWDTVVNRRSTSWKALSSGARESMSDENALQAIIESPTLIKRPVLEDKDLLEFGFGEERYQELLAKR